jgi:hypothetical protein
MASSVTFNNAGEAFDTVAEALSDLKNYWEGSALKLHNFQ